MASIRLIPEERLSECPQYHRTPLLAPALASILSASAGRASSAAVPLVLLSLAAALIASALLKLSTADDKWVKLLVLATAVLIGSCRGAHWRFVEASVEGLQGSGVKIEAVVVVLGAPEAVAGGRVKFVGRVLRMGLIGATAGRRSEPAQTDFASIRYVLAQVEAAESDSVVPGALIVLRGRISKPYVAKNPGEFDYARYLATKRVFAVLDGLPVDCPPPEDVQFPMSLKAATAVRERVRSVLAEAIPGDEGALMAALLLGDDSALAPETSLGLQRAGLTRFLSLTGFHVEFLSWLVGLILAKTTGRNGISRIGAVLAAVSAAVFAGGGAGAIRAATCASMRNLAPLVRRKYNHMAGLAASMMLVVWFIPFPLTDPGFALSFAASLGAFAGARYRDKNTEEPDDGRMGGVARRVLGRLAAPAGLVVGLIPVMAVTFREISLVGFVLGGFWAVLVIPLMLFALLTAALPLVVTRLLGWIPYTLARGVLAISAFAAKVPCAAIRVPAPSGAMICAWYCAFGLAAWILEERARVRAGAAKESRLKKRIHAIALAAISVVFLVLSWVRAYSPWPLVTFLSVGQGDCAVVRWRGRVIVVDTGTGAAFARCVSPYLRWAGISRVDLCVLSHLHDDHVGGLSLLCSEARIEALLIPPGSSSEVRDMLSAAPPATCAPTLIEAVRHAVYRLGQTSVDVLSAGLEDRQSKTVSGDENENSVVVVLTFAGHDAAFEFWGDAPRELIEDVLVGVNEAGGSVMSVVKVPHHGSVNSLTEGFYTRVRGGLAVVSVGKNSYGHPSSKVLNSALGAGLDVRRTDLNGAITVEGKGKRVKVTSFLR